MTIGDSNGASNHGWVVQLKKLLPDDLIYNYSRPGNTIGFDNLNQSKLNTLKQLNTYLVDLRSKTDRVDHIIILLGTNDCKATFKAREGEVSTHLGKLIQSIRITDWIHRSKAKITIVSPPPYGPDDQLLPKYHGGDICVQKLITEYQEICEQSGVTFVNIYDALKPRFTALSKDGVHLNEEGQMIIAKSIQNNLMNP